jgi:hypothetical protein
MWMIWEQTGVMTLNYRVLTVGRDEIECVSVPPGEAAHFISAAQFVAVQRSRAQP